MGAFDGLNEWARGLWATNGLELRGEMGLPGKIGIVLTAVASFGLIAAILGASVLLLSFTLVPVFAVWGYFWKPFGVILAVIWSWFSATVYAQTHRMPCEGRQGEDAQNVIRLKEGEHMTKQHSSRADGQG